MNLVAIGGRPGLYICPVGSCGHIVSVAGVCSKLFRQDLVVSGSNAWHPCTTYCCLDEIDVANTMLVALGMEYHLLVACLLAKLVAKIGRVSLDVGEISVRYEVNMNIPQRENETATVTPPRSDLI